VYGNEFNPKKIVRLASIALGVGRISEQRRVGSDKTSGHAALFGVLEGGDLVPGPFTVGRDPRQWTVRRVRLLPGRDRACVSTGDGGAWRIFAPRCLGQTFYSLGVVFVLQPPNNLAAP
jgi:hypothetical protein